MPPLPSAHSVQKRSLSIAGHRTSIALEPEFWARLEAMAAERHTPLAALIREIDEARDIPNLSSALRLAVLRGYEERLARAATDGPA
jgi:predicted DNA-binding ribbon-helix-helix protein